MLEQVKELGMEKFAGDEKLANAMVEAFAEEFEKQASLITKETGPAAVKDLIKGFSESFGKGVGSLAITGLVTGMTAATRMIGDDRRHLKFMEALEKALNSNPFLRNSDRAKVNQYASTIYKFAPNVATDSNLLSSVLANAVHGEGIDPQTIKSLTDLEGRLRENNSFSPKTYV